MAPQTSKGSEASRKFKLTTTCRICGGGDLVPIIDLGEQQLTGVFPREGDPEPTRGPLRLVKCHGAGANAGCGLIQLSHSFDLTELYGANYGYRSGLNASMVAHLHSKIPKLLDKVSLTSGDLVVDIGSNDSTFLQGYSNPGLTLVGVDPTGSKFRQFYPEHIQLIPDFFSPQAIRDRFGSQKAKVVTSIAMFYDLERPLEFMAQIRDILHDDGIWLFEQSYLPAMLDMNAYDTICHEHLEYYGLQQIKWMTDRAGFKIIDIELNSANGGSFCVTVAKDNSAHRPIAALIDTLLHVEDRKGLQTLRPFREFEQRVQHHREELRGFVHGITDRGGRIFGYGASTKGNVILQYCDFSGKDIGCVAEVNSEKFGCRTPGTKIPIVSEADARKENPDYFLVLPWHFKQGIIERERKFLEKGGRLVFPLPSIEVYSS